MAMGPEPVLSLDLVHKLGSPVGKLFIHIITREICHIQSLETAFCLSTHSCSEMREEQQGESTINSSSLPTPSNRWCKQSTKIILLVFFYKCTLICTPLLTKFV